MLRPAQLILIASLVVVAACSGPPAAPETTAPEIAAIGDAPNQDGSFRLPVSLNEVMVALVNQAADPLWVSAWSAPETDADWRELERRAYQLELAGALLLFPGTGALDQKWVIQPQWKTWSNQLRDMGADAVVAVRNRNIDEISAIGDRTVEICEGCHVDFKLAYPTQGKFGELSPTATDLDDQ